MAHDEHKTTPPIKPLRMWATINTKTGAITQVGRTRKDAAQGYRYLTFTGMRRQVRVVVTAEDVAWWCWMCGRMVSDRCSDPACIVGPPIVDLQR